jgi:hypothetical protein
LYYDSLGWDPLYPSFYMPRGVGFTREVRVSYSPTQLGLYLYLPILQDLSIDYLLNRLSDGPPSLDP